MAIGAGAGLAASTRGAIVYTEGVERKQKVREDFRDFGYYSSTITTTTTKKGTVATHTQK